MGGKAPPQNLKVAIGAFDHDIQLWDNNAATLDHARQDATGLTIDAKAFGPAAWFGVADKYNQVQQMIENLCGEGGDEFRAIATNLGTAKTAYLQQEQQLGYDISGIH